MQLNESLLLSEKKIYPWALSLSDRFLQMGGDGREGEQERKKKEKPVLSPLG